MEEIKHLAMLIEHQAQKYGHRAELHDTDHVTGKWFSISWYRLNEHVETLANALCEIGLQEKGRVAFFAQNMWELIAADFAVFRNHATSIPLYATSTKEQVEFIVRDSQLSILFAGDQYQYDIALQVLGCDTSLKTIVAIEPSIDLRGCKQAYRFSDLMEIGKARTCAAEIQNRLAHCSQDDLMTILYTSGTTGNPKGVSLFQRTYTECLRIHRIRIHTLTDNDTSMCFLPLSHVFERGWCYVCLDRGAAIYINRKPAEIQQTLTEIRPNVMCAVPRFWEKVYAAIWQKIDSFPPYLRSLMLKSIQMGREYNLQYKRYGKHAPKRLALGYRLVAKPLFHLVPKAAGIDKGKFFPTAGAKLSDEINEFLHALGINIVVGYGLTESCATVSCYLPDGRDYVINSVGRIMPDVDVRISPEGEILLKGKTITTGYYQRDDANKESFTDDGWFRTGDAGYIDQDGNLYLTDRIKDLFKTAGGKYIAPQELENIVCNDKYVDQAAAIGNERKYVTMLIVPDFQQLKAYANAHDIAYTDYADLLGKPEIQSLYQSMIDEKNKALARYEQIKYFTLLPSPFTMEQGLLTNTLKIKRKVVERLYEKEIAVMYAH